MRRLFFLAFVLVPTFALAQDYQMYETQYLKILPGHAKQFNEAMKAHNERFHASSPYGARVWYVSNGPRTGRMLWVMGPSTFTDFDSRPSGEAHDGDWANSVLAHAESGETNWWKLDPELSYQPDNMPSPLTKARLTIFDIKPSEGQRFEELRRKLRQVRKAKQYPNPSGFYRNTARSGTGRDYVNVMSFDKWAEADRPVDFPADYEEVHGKGSWRHFLREIDEVVLHSEEEFQELIPELSARPPAASDQ